MINVAESGLWQRSMVQDDTINSNEGKCKHQKTDHKHPASNYNYNKDQFVLIVWP